MRLTADHVRVTVPATAGNLGPGFDALGLALGVRDQVEVRAVAAARVDLEIEGEGAETLPRDETHLMVRAIRAGLDAVGASQTGLMIRATNRIPHGRGLGSSAAAVVAGLAAVRGLIAEPEAFDNTAMLQLATEFEGHPDNAAPAIWGGATVAWMDHLGAHGAPLALDPTLESLVLVPASVLPTREARAVLPPQVPHVDAAFNAGRSALLVHALTGHPEVLLAATEDRLHQGYRASVMRPAAALVAHLRDAGHAAVVSGAGPSVLVLGHGLGALNVAALAGIGGETWRGVHGVGVLPGVTSERVTPAS